MAKIFICWIEEILEHKFILMRAAHFFKFYDVSAGGENEKS